MTFDPMVSMSMSMAAMVLLPLSLYYQFRFEIFSGGDVWADRRKRKTKTTEMI